MSDWDDDLARRAAAYQDARRTAQPHAQIPYVHAPSVTTSRRGSDLIPGRPELVEVDAADLRTLANHIEDAGNLVASATTGAWSGQAADAYDSSRDAYRRSLWGAADALHAAAGALEVFAEALRWAQDQAAAAIHTAQARAVDVQQREKHADEAEDQLRVAMLGLADAEDELNRVMRANSNFLPPPGTKAGEWLNALGDSWDAMPWWEQILAVVTVSAVVAASGGTMGVAMGVGGVAAFAADHANGAATFVDNPNAGWNGYWSHATPGSVATDVSVAALTFGPWAFTGAVAGRGAAIVAGELAADSSAVFARLQANLLASGDAGVVDWSAFLAREPAQLADGALIQAVDPALEQQLMQRAADLPAGPMKAFGEAGTYQASVSGTTHELVVTTEAGRKLSIDGLSAQYGLAVQDAKLVENELSSFYIPETLDPRVAGVATSKMDDALRKAAEASHAVGGGGRVEIATNSLASAEVWEARMRAIGIEGYARIVPQGGA